MTTKIPDHDLNHEVYINPKDHKEQEEILKDEKIKQRELESAKSKESDKDESEQNLSGRLENFEVDKTTKKLIWKKKMKINYGK